MHDNDADGLRMLADVDRLIGLIDAVRQAVTPQEHAAARQALHEEIQRQRDERQVRHRRRIRDRFVLDGILRASGEEPVFYRLEECGSAVKGRPMDTPVFVSGVCCWILPEGETPPQIGVCAWLDDDTGCHDTVAYHVQSGDRWWFALCTAHAARARAEWDIAHIRNVAG